MQSEHFDMKVVGTMIVFTLLLHSLYMTGTQNLILGFTFTDSFTKGKF